ncbi:hypothetical protein OKA04_07420 [Luteolibacter flavescens]|uniref:Uncharacterized protein n=1 Tax=Luteolibacter flavescens TaxID=1859460 RepID=A0ABT3FM82_9BACT|nr:hypothetical protein [Luteolibacter flavescens]MCW1884557.1 hypothetical protein [Luteolibacter flavescens]
MALPFSATFTSGTATGSTWPLAPALMSGMVSPVGPVIGSPSPLVSQASAFSFVPAARPS